MEVFGLPGIDVAAWCWCDGLGGWSGCPGRVWGNRRAGCCISWLAGCSGWQVGCLGMGNAAGREEADVSQLVVGMVVARSLSWASGAAADYAVGAGPGGAVPGTRRAL